MTQPVAGYTNGSTGTTLDTLAATFAAKVADADRAKQAARNERARAMRTLYESGAQTADLAETFHCSTLTVANEIKRAGGTMRPRGMTSERARVLAASRKNVAVARTVRDTLLRRIEAKLDTLLAKLGEA